ncbi:MAG: hypothetical protein ACU0B9_11350 [Limimaricola soesokkakensis]|uniref:hypothetical protein n=1 Tax=Limimaricola soesokkakensis TaxID=1343159 RepID=UPI004058669C
MTTPPSLEDFAYAALRSGRIFAQCWSDAGLECRGASCGLWSAACDRLAAGRMPKGRDLDMLVAMGEALRRALNAERPGYGDHAMREDTRYEAPLLEPRLEELRRLAEVYKHFRDCRERYADRLTAEREVARAL